MFHSPKRTEAHDRYAYRLLLTVVALMPLALFVGTAVPAQISKLAFGGIGVLLVAIVLAGTYIKDQTISFPKTAALGAVWLLPVAYLLSTLFGDRAANAMYGEQLTMDSAAFFLIGALACTLTALLVTNTKRLLGMHLTLLGSAIALSLVQLILFFARDTIASTGIVMRSLSLLGSLNDLAIFFGLIVIFLLLALALLPITAAIRAVLWCALALTLYVLAVVNLTLTWWVVGLLALAVFVFSVYRTHFGDTKQQAVSFASLATLAIAALFLFGPAGVVGTPASTANVGELDVRPSWTSTITIGRTALSEHTFFGAGPGSFTSLWSENIPRSIYQTDFWLADFFWGIGFVPTSIVSTGLVGAIGWLVFLCFFIFIGIRSLILRAHVKDGALAQYFRVTSFLAALYLWFMCFTQVPSPALVLLAFVLTGLFIGSLAASDKHQVSLYTIVLGDNPRIGFLATLGLTILILVSVGGVYGLGTRFSAEVAYQKGLDAVNQSNDIDTAEAFLERAIYLHPTDTYYRTQSQLEFRRLETEIGEGGEPEQIRESVQALLAQTIDSATRATELDPDDYRNWRRLGTIYQNIIPLGIDGAEESAVAALSRALELRPQSPDLLLARASVERAQGSVDVAIETVGEAISVRNRYSDATFFLAQLQLENDQVEEAKRSVQALTVFEPRNPVAFFQLGVLHYGTEDYLAAVQSFERAVALADTYANARYFLALAYWRLEEPERATRELKLVLETNPTNVEVQAMIENLEAGRAPFESESAAADVGKLEGLPLDELDTAPVVDAEVQTPREVDEVTE